MTDIMIDFTKRGKGKRYQTGVCHFCNSEKYPNGKVIDPSTDRNARKTYEGDWKCGTCVEEESRELLRLMRGVI